MANTPEIPLLPKSAVIGKMSDIIEDMQAMVYGEDDDLLVRFQFNEVTEEVVGEYRDAVAMRKFKKKLDKLAMLYETLASMK